MKRCLQLLVVFGFGGVILIVYSLKSMPLPATLPTAYVVKQDLKVNIKTVGELEAARSISIASSIKGDLGKIIELIPDGVYVEPGQVLVKIDSTPFEEKIEQLRAQMKEQESYIASLEQTLEWERVQTEHKNRTALLEMESAQLELERVIYGEGPQEMSRLKAAMQKSWLTYTELNAYAQDLLELKALGYLNTTELKQADKKRLEEEEAYEMAKQQYESYIQHVYPMQVKKGETSVKRAEVMKEETAKSGCYRVAQSIALLEQAKQERVDQHVQLRNAEKELKQTDIVAPASGMVVLREEYRASQRRKPRVGDILVKNQPFLDLPDLSAMIVKTRIREVDLFKVEPGKKATIEVDAYPHLSFTGTLTSIGVLALSEMGRTGEEKSFEVRVALEESDPRLRPGMTARVIIHADEAKEVLTIPLEAVFSERQQAYCLVFDESHRYERRNIQLGISNEQWVEVTGGLQEGECLSLLDSER